MTRQRLFRAGALLTAVLLIGAVAGWLLAPRDMRSPAPIEAVRADRAATTLEVTYLAGAEGCADPGGVEVAEDSAEVRLAAGTIGRDQYLFRSNPCPAIGRSARATVTLSAPLGDRRVIDTSRADEAGGGVVQVQAP